MVFELPAWLIDLTNGFPSTAAYLSCFPQIQSEFDFFFFCKWQLDRFIPNRSAMDFDFAHFMLTGGRVEKQNSSSPCSPSKEAYRRQLAEIFNMNRTRILAFKNKPPASEATVSESISSVPHSKRPKHRRCIPQVSFPFFPCLRLIFPVSPWWLILFMNFLSSLVIVSNFPLVTYFCFIFVANLFSWLIFPILQVDFFSNLFALVFQNYFLTKFSGDQRQTNRFWHENISHFSQA